MTTATRIDRGSTDTTAIYTEGTDLVFERTFDAPREQVWMALTDPELVPRWWGPHGTTTTIVEMDVRPGGRWRYRNSASDRGDVVFFGEYLSVDPPTEYRWTFNFELDGSEVEGGPETYRFGEAYGRTTVTAIGHMGSPENIDDVLATGMVAGAIETWDRLEALLTEL